MDTISTGRAPQPLARVVAWVAAGVVLGGFALTACGGSGSDAAAGPEGAATPAGPASPAAPVPTASASPESPGSPSDDPGSSSAPPGESSAASPKPSSTREVPVLTERDSGKTLAIAVGESVALRLSNEWLWSQPQVDGRAIILAPVDHLIDPGYTEWAVEAIDVGDVVIRVTGTPQCPPGADCPPAVDLAFTIQVQG